MFAFSLFLLPFLGSSPRGTMSYRMQEIFCPSVRTYVRTSIRTFCLQGPKARPLGPGLSLQALASASEAWPWDPGGRTYGRTYVRTDKISPAFYRTSSLWGRCQKRTSTTNKTRRNGTLELIFGRSSWELSRPDCALERESPDNQGCGEGVLNPLRFKRNVFHLF